MPKLNEPPYRFALLYPAQHPRAGKNEELLGPSTLGIEVTEPALAARCGLGSIDPQHGPTPELGRAAIDVALDWPTPPPGSLLVTQKADSDALGAMAVLDLRQAGCPLCNEMLARVQQLSRWDRFDQGGWVEWQSFHPPLPHPAHALDTGLPLAIRALRPLARDSAMPLAARVAAIGAWLQKGELPPGAKATSMVFEKDLLAQWNAGEISLHATEDFRLVRLRARDRAGLFLGYRQAPVVIAESTGHHRRLAVGQFERGWIDMTRLLDELAALEPGWGGSATLIASPHGADTRLNSAEVEARALDCLGPKSRAE